LFTSAAALFRTPKALMTWIWDGQSAGRKEKQLRKKVYFNNKKSIARI